MAGKLVLSTLNDDTGVLNVQNGMTGICKAWVAWNGIPSSPTIYGQFNVSSVTKITTGQYTINFSTSMPNANYSIAGLPGADGRWMIKLSAPTASSFNVGNYNGSYADADNLSVAIFSS